MIDLEVVSNRYVVDTNIIIYILKGLRSAIEVWVTRPDSAPGPNVGP